MSSPVARELAAARRALETAEVSLKNEREARARAERMNEQKDQFLRLVAHELRGPLGAILGWAHMLRRRGGQEEFDRGLDVIEQSVQAQARLIEDLLDLGRMSSGRIQLDMDAVEPRVLIDAAIEEITPAARAREIGVRKVLDLTVGALRGDPKRLQQVLVRLLTNAVQYSPEQSVIEVALRSAHGHAEISVRDEGAGIAASALPHLFEPFTQPDASSTPRRCGLGVGLALAKHVVELHGGSIQAQSAGEGRGATFTVCLPLAGVQDAPVP